MVFMDNKQISIMKKYLLFLVFPLLVACSTDKDEPIVTICPKDAVFIGTWEVTDISNVDKVAPVKWDNWKDYYGRIFIAFNDDYTCDTYYIGASKEIAESTLPKFPYIYSQFVFNGIDKIFCSNHEYQEIPNAVLVVKVYTGNIMEVVLEDGQYCMLSSYSKPQLYLKLKRQSF